MSLRSEIELGYEEIEDDHATARKIQADEDYKQRVFKHLLSGGLRCQNCGSIENVCKGPNPFALEIYGDDSHTVECGECLHQSAMDI